MGAPQRRQRPRRSSQDTTGTLSKNATGVPQEGQREPGWTTESPRGNRWMHTFAKEPTIAPVAKKRPRRTPSTAFTSASFPRERGRRVGRATPSSPPRPRGRRRGDRRVRGGGRPPAEAPPKGRGPRGGAEPWSRPRAPPSRDRTRA